MAALLVAHVARGRADQAGDSKLLHILAHIDLDERLLVAEHLGRELLREHRLANARGADEEERADRAARILQVGAGAAQGAGDRDGGNILADDGLLQLGLHLEQLLVVLLLHSGQRDAGPVGDHLHHQVLVDGDALFVSALLPIGGDLLFAGAELFLLIAELGGLLEVLVADRLLLLGADGLDLGREVLDVGGAAEGGDAGAGAGLIHHVDRLVRQEAAGDVAIGELGGRFQRRIGEDGLVVVLILAADPLEDEDGILDRGGLDLDRLEAAIEGGVLLDVLAVLVEGRGANALELAAGEGGLEDVGGVHRAFGGAGSDNRVELVDEEDDVPGAADLVHHRLDAFLELAAVLGSGDHQGEVEGDDLLLGQDLGDVTRGDLLRQTLDDGGLTHAGLTDEDGVVLGAAAEDLDDAADLVAAADHGVHFALTSELGEVAAEGLEGGGLDLLLLLRLGAGTLRAAGGGLFARFAALGGLAAGELWVEFPEDLVAGALDVDLEGLEHAGGNALPFPQEAEEDVFRTDVGMAEGLGFLAGEREDLLNPGGVGDTGLRLGLLAGADLLFHRGADGLKVEPHLLEHADGDALSQLDQPEQEVLGADVVMMEPVGLLAGQREDLLRPGSEVVHWFLGHGRGGLSGWLRRPRPDWQGGSQGAGRRRTRSAAGRRGGHRAGRRRTRPGACVGGGRAGPRSGVGR